jgi:hypothetical protein
VVPFGNTLHVSGHDAPRLRATIDQARGPDRECREIPSSLEDVFICLMDHAEDNFK